MKIVAISASLNPKSKSKAMLERFLKMTGQKYLWFNLGENQKQCKECARGDESRCKVRCTDNSVLGEVTQDCLTAIEECDLLIVASPCYWWGVPGNLKVVLDRLSPLRFSKLHGKQAIAIVSGAEDGSHATAMQILSILSDIGFDIPAHGALYSNHELGKDRLIERDMRNLAARFKK